MELCYNLTLFYIIWYKLSQHTSYKLKYVVLDNIEKLRI